MRYKAIEKVESNKLANDLLDKGSLSSNWYCNLIGNGEAKVDMQASSRGVHLGVNGQARSYLSRSHSGIDRKQQLGRQLAAQFRTSTIELAGLDLTQRKKGHLDAASASRKDTCCFNCGTAYLEDQTHVMIICPLYNTWRTNLLQSVSRYYPDMSKFDGMNAREKTIWLLGNDNPKICYAMNVYLVEMWRYRRQLLSDRIRLAVPRAERPDSDPQRQVVVLEACDDDVVILRHSVEISDSDSDVDEEGWDDHSSTSSLSVRLLPEFEQAQTDNAE